MDRVLATRLDGRVFDEMDRVVKARGISRKQFLEDVIRAGARRLGRQPSTDVWARTLGAWNRREPPQATVRRARSAFRRALARHTSR